MQRKRYYPILSMSLMLAALLVLSFSATPSYSQDRTVSLGEQTQLQVTYEQAKEARFSNPSDATEQAFVAAQEAVARVRGDYAPAEIAGMLSYSGTNVGGPTFLRPSAGCTASGPTVNYDAQYFFVDATGAYDFLSTQTYDGYLHLYEGSFDPADPTTNCIAGNDDFPGVGLSGFNGVALTAATQYILVTSAWGFGNNVGDFVNDISGPGNIFLGMPFSDLEIDKTVEADAQTREGTYHVGITNNGPAGADDVEVTDFLPGALSVTGWSTYNNTSFNPNTGVWEVGDMASGDTDSLWIHVTFEAQGRYTNHVLITAGDALDNNLANNEAEVSIVFLGDRVVPDFVPGGSAGGIVNRGERFSADLAVTKTVDVETAVTDDEVTFTVMVENLGPQSTAKVEVTDELDACLDFVSAAADKGSYDPATGVWTVGALKDGEKATLEIVATVTAACSGTITNTAEVTSSSLPDPSSFFNLFGEPGAEANNSASADFAANAANARELDGQTFALGHNYPNPFNPATVVPFSLAEAATVSIQVYDLLGRSVATLVDGPMSAGVHEVRFEASHLPTGMYIVRMEAGSIVKTQRITLMK